MRRLALFVVSAQAILVVAFGFVLRSKTPKFPLGIPGEWEWLRIDASMVGYSLILAVVAILGFAVFAAAGFQSLSRPGRPVREGFWLSGLVFAAILVQAVTQEAAPVGYGLSKWIIALHAPGSSGYYTVAKNQMSDPARFLADYPSWIARQDALHVGTHPPGLFVVARGMLSAMESRPELSRRVIELSPRSVASAVKAYRETLDLSRADGAALALTGALTLLACALSVVPIYLLARSVLPASAAWASAALWPLVPSALLFQPTADTAFPLLSTTAIALASWAVRSGRKTGLMLGLLSGLTMALGMFFTLAFLPVGLVVALVLLSPSGLTPSRKVGLFLVTGLGFLAATFAWWGLTSASPFVIWWINQKNHGRFYAEYPRSYWAWVLENPLELAIALGLPAAVWGLVGLAKPRQIPRVTWATVLVLAFLTFSGKNLSEVARLWLPLMPGLLVGAGSVLARLGARPWELGATIALTGLQVLCLEATIQVVYPI